MSALLPTLAFTALVIAQFTAVIAAAGEIPRSRAASATRAAQHRLSVSMLD